MNVDNLTIVCTPPHGKHFQAALNSVDEWNDVGRRWELCYLALHPTSPCNLYLAFDGAEFVGIAKVSADPDHVVGSDLWPDGWYTYLSFMATKRTGSGYGTRMMDAILADCAKIGVGLYLASLADSCWFYEKIGFHTYAIDAFWLTASQVAKRFPTKVGVHG